MTWRHGGGGDIELHGGASRSDVDVMSMVSSLSGGTVTVHRPWYLQYCGGAAASGATVAVAICHTWCCHGLCSRSVHIVYGK